MKKTKLSIEKVEGEVVTLSIENNSLKMPKDFLPKGVKVGDQVYLTLTTVKEESASQEELARALLNEVFKEG